VAESIPISDNKMFNPILKRSLGRLHVPALPFYQEANFLFLLLSHGGVESDSLSSLLRHLIHTIILAHQVFISIHSVLLYLGLFP